MKGACAIIVAIFVVVGSSVAFAQRRAPRRVRVATSTLPSSTSAGARDSRRIVGSPTSSIEQPRRTISPDMARALAPVVFGAAQRIHVPVVERGTVFLDPPDANEKKPSRWRVAPKLMTFWTGGAGVGLKLLY